MPEAAIKQHKPAIYSFAALKSNQREIKDRALEEVVHVTENGNAAFVFCSEELFEQAKAEAAEEAVRNMEIAQIIRQGRKDIAEGRCIEGLDAAKERMHRIWQKNG